jgi:hypothetical protein
VAERLLCLSSSNNKKEKKQRRDIAGNGRINLLFAQLRLASTAVLGAGNQTLSLASVAVLCDGGTVSIKVVK